MLAGLTKISEIFAYKEENGELIPCDGLLCYRGINVQDLVKGFMEDDRFGFEETVYLLLFSNIARIKNSWRTFPACCRPIADYRPALFVTLS